MADTAGKTSRTFMDEIATLPTTNFRIFVGITLGTLFVITCLAGIILGRINDENAYTLSVVGGFILIMMGLDVTQYVFKRKTFDPVTLGNKREDVDPQPAAPAILNPADTPKADPTPGVTTPSTDLSKPASGASQPRNQHQNEAGE